MRLECPNYRQKIIPIETNFDADDLDLNESVRKMLREEVEVNLLEINHKTSFLIHFVSCSLDCFQYNCLSEVQRKPKKRVKYQRSGHPKGPEHVHGNGKTESGCKINHLNIP